MRGHYLYFMDLFLQKWSLILHALAITGILIIIRLIIGFFGLDIFSVTNLITAFVGGAIFTIAIILTGTLTDYKESEKIPGELTTSISALYADSDLVRKPHTEITGDIKGHVRELLAAINNNFKRNSWNASEIKGVIAKVNDDIYRLADNGAAPQFLVKLRTELTNIERFSNRIQIIKYTSFIPAAYAIAELAAAGVILILLFVRQDPFYESLVLFTALSSLLISLLLLIRDMDDPFEVGQKSYADVDLTILFELEKEISYCQTDK
jgi:hypothetical protein